MPKNNNRRSLRREIIRALVLALITFIALTAVFYWALKQPTPAAPGLPPAEKVSVQPADLSVLRLGYVGTVPLLLTVAQQENYFARYGLTVALVPYPNRQLMENDLAKQHLHAAIYSEGQLAHFAFRLFPILPLAIIAQVESTPPDYLVALPPQRLQQAEDLVNQTIFYRPLSSAQFSLGVLLNTPQRARDALTQNANLALQSEVDPEVEAIMYHQALPYLAATLLPVLDGAALRAKLQQAGAIVALDFWMAQNIKKHHPNASLLTAERDGALFLVTNRLWLQPAKEELLSLTGALQQASVWVQHNQAAALELYLTSQSQTTSPALQAWFKPQKFRLSLQRAVWDRTRENVSIIRHFWAGYMEKDTQKLALLFAPEIMLAVQPSSVDMLFVLLNDD